MDKMGRIIWIDRAKKEVLQKAKEHTIKEGKLT